MLSLPWTRLSLSEAVPHATAAPKAKGRKLSFKEKAELESMESTILAVEQEAESIEALLHDPDFQAKRFAEIPEFVAKLDAVKANAASLYSRWEELEALREAAAG